MSAYPKNCFCTIRKEKNGWRNADAQITTDTLVFPNYYEDIDLPYEFIETEEVHAGGKLLPTHEWSKGYPMASVSPKTNLQTARFWYYLLGTCVTTGTDTTVTGRTITYGGVGKVVTLSGAAMVVDAHIGQVMVVTAGDQINHYWYITDNDANTLTLDETDAALPANLNADVVKIVGPPYTHAISMANQGTTMPSFTMHAEYEDWTHYQDFLGCIITEIEDTCKEEGKWEETPTIESPYRVAGANHSAPSPQFHTDEQLVWVTHVNTFQVQYNGVNLDSVTDLRDWVDEITVTGKRKYEYKKAGGDAGFTDMIMTGFEFECKFNYRFQGYQAATIANLLITAYAGALTLDLKLQRSATDYIRWQVDKCKMVKLDGMKFPSKDDGELIQPITLKLAPDTTGAALTVTAVDAYSHKYYEDASE